MQAKAEQASEADKLAKHQARTPEVAVQSVGSALHNRKATMAKSQAKIIELEAAAKAAVEAVEEAKQKADKLQAGIDNLQTDYEAEVGRLVKTSDPVTRLQKSVREAFQALCGSVEAQLLISHLETSFTGLSSLLAAATPTICSQTRTGPFQLMRWPGPSNARWRGSPRTSARPSARPRSRSSTSTSSKSAGFSHLQCHLNTTYCAYISRLLQARDHRFHPLQRFLLEKDFPFVSHIKNNLDNYHGQRHSVEMRTVDARHNSSQ